MKRAFICIVMLMLAYMSALALERDTGKRWFAGVHAGTNFVVGDNITDHPPFKYFFDAIGVDGGMYIGKFFTPSIGGRLDFSYGKAHNRADAEFVENNEMFKNSFTNNGYYAYNVFTVGADVLFDFTSMCSNHASDPFHVIGLAGLGMWSTADFKFEKRTPKTSMTSEEALKILASQGDCTSVYGRLGLILDYRVNNNISFNVEGNAGIMGDKFDGIDYDSEFDFLFKLQLGVTYSF